MRDLAVRVPSVEALKNALGCDDLFGWLEAEATELAELGGWRNRVSFTDEMLRSRGIRAVVREAPGDLAHAAVIEFGSRGSVIRYSATTPTRIRFSIAHEIGHTYFADAEGRTISANGFRTDLTVESLCSYFARALLLPKARVVDRLSKLDGKRAIPPLHLVPQLAREFDVSEQAVVRRLVFDLFEGFAAAACATKQGERRGWRTTWCAPLGAHDFPRSSGWRVPLSSNGRRLPPEMVPVCEPVGTTVTSVDGRWADLSRPKTPVQCRVPFSRLPAMADVEAVVATVPVNRGLFDEPLAKCFVALRERQQRQPKRSETPAS